MGRALTRVISETPGAVLTGALEAPGSRYWQGCRRARGHHRKCIKLSADLWKLSANADGILDFTVPGATIANVAIAAERGLVHVIGTTGLSASDDAVIKSVTQRAIVVKSGNMSLGVNLLAALVKRVAQSLDEGLTSKFLKCTTRPRSTRPRAPRSCSARPRPPPQDRARGSFGARPRWSHRGAQERRYWLCLLARRPRHGRSQCDFRRSP